MRMYFTLMMPFFLIASIAAQPKKDLYIIDFHNDKEYNSILGKNVANEFENSLQLCKGKYRIIPRMKYQRQLEEKTFEYTKRFLQEEGIDYVIYGDIFHDDNSKTFNIEYIFEEVNTGSIILIEGISFDHIGKLVNVNIRKNAIEEKLINDEELCKRFSDKITNPTIIDEDATAKVDATDIMDKDSDGDGVPDALDKEPNTPIAATVDERGVEVFVQAKGADTWKEKEKNIIFDMLPDLPEISFNPGDSEFSEEAYMQLDQMAKLMKMYPVMVVRLEGIDAENETLAAERATKIKDFLIKNYRLPEKRFVTKTTIEAETPPKVIATVAKEMMNF
jgi:outer membrane protein OmpA-like peptidoglycan-associated protein